HQRTGQGRDHRRGGGRVELGMLRIGQATDIAGELEDGVLKSAAGPEERAVSLAGVANRGKGAGRVRVGAGRYAPDAIQTGKAPGRIGDGRGVNPDAFDMGGNQPQGFRDRLVSDHRGVEIPNQRDTKASHWNEYGKTGSGRRVGRGSKEADARVVFGQTKRI